MTDMDYSDMLKAELIAECEKRGLDTSGDNDSQPKEKAPKKKKKVFNSMLFRFE
jgi:hypothetical protein